MPSRRIEHVDVLRAISVLLVLFSHLNRQKAEVSFSAWGIFNRALVLISGGGWIGVDLFFVLSGFLVSGLILRELKDRGHFNASRFLIRRGFKIYPAFYAMILVSIPFWAWMGQPADASKVLHELFFIQNYFHGIWSHTWSLAVEEHFYVLLCSGFFLFLRRLEARRISRIPWIIAAACLFTFILRIYWHWKYPYDLFTHYMASHLRMDALFAGVGISYLYHFHRESFEKWAVRYRGVWTVLGIVLIAPCFFKGTGGWHVYSAGLTMLYLGAGSLIMAAMGFRFIAMGRVSSSTRFFAKIGEYSYSIYLWHMIVREAYGKFFPDIQMAAQLSYVPIAVIFGIALGKLIEMPFLSMRDRWFPSPAGAAEREVKVAA